MKGVVVAKECYASLVFQVCIHIKHTKKNISIVRKKKHITPRIFDTIFNEILTENKPMEI
jgi:hypothetical protein